MRSLSATTLNFNQLAKLIEFDDIIILKTGNGLYLGKEMKYGTEICNVEVAYNANFGYDIEIRINRKNRLNLMMSSF